MCHVTYVEVRIMTIVTARQGYRRSHKCPELLYRARKTGEGAPAGALVGGVRRKGTYPLSVPRNFIANQ